MSSLTSFVVDSCHVIILKIDHSVCVFNDSTGGRRERGQGERR